MKFYSLNKKSPMVGFTDALMNGLAPDGGLYYPKSFPVFSKKELNQFIGKNLSSVARIVLTKWLGDEFSKKTIKDVINRALDFPIPLKKVGPYYVLELFHGPTMAFKDVAAKTLAQLMSKVLAKKNKKITVLVATSGDTGGAVVQGFAGIQNIRVVVLFPKKNVSQLQKEQLTRVEKNVFSLAVEGVFDDCQRLVKEAFVDDDLKKLNLTSANSINIGRLIPQTIYYAYVFSKIRKNNIEFIIPSGNLGNLTAGVFSYKMGLPIKSFIAACNTNDSLVKYYQTGGYQPQKTIPTLSNAMDIGAPNNFPRLVKVFDNKHSLFKKMVKVVSVNNTETIKTIKEVYKKYHYLLDPHTAVGWAAAKRLSNPKNISVIVSTASPIKFAAEIYRETGIKVDNKKAIEKLKRLTKRKYEIKNNYQEFKKLLVKLSRQ
jgi:threonine synthase